VKITLKNIENHLASLDENGSREKAIGDWIEFIAGMITHYNQEIIEAKKDKDFFEGLYKTQFADNDNRGMVNDILHQICENEFNCMKKIKEYKELLEMVASLSKEKAIK